MHFIVVSFFLQLLDFFTISQRFNIAFYDCYCKSRPSFFIVSIFLLHAFSLFFRFCQVSQQYFFFVWFSATTSCILVICTRNDNVIMWCAFRFSEIKHDITASISADFLLDFWRQQRAPNQMDVFSGALPIALYRLKILAFTRCHRTKSERKYETQCEVIEAGAWH